MLCFNIIPITAVRTAHGTVTMDAYHQEYWRPGNRSSFTDPDWLHASLILQTKSRVMC